MTQDAVVTKVLANNMAEVVVSRGTACGSNCGSCESCVFQNEIKTLAKNTVNATRGEKVVIETVSKDIFGAAFLLYIVPFIAFFIAYAVAYSADLSDTLCIIISCAALVLCFLAVILYQKIKRGSKPIKFEIVQIRE